MPTLRISQPVRIVHGKGTGALRKAVQPVSPPPEAAWLRILIVGGNYGEGDAGVTIVTFK